MLELLVYRVKVRGAELLGKRRMAELRLALFKRGDYGFPESGLVELYLTPALFHRHLCGLGIDGVFLRAHILVDCGDALIDAGVDILI